MAKRRAALSADCIFNGYLRRVLKRRKAPINFPNILPHWRAGAWEWNKNVIYVLVMLQLIYGLCRAPSMTDKQNPRLFIESLSCCCFFPLFLPRWMLRWDVSSTNFSKASFLRSDKGCKLCQAYHCCSIILGSSCTQILWHGEAKGK